jgi:hypothetical protein
MLRKWIIAYKLKVYTRVASYITEMEIPRTQHDYESSYAFKLYILQFINHYSSIFYIAYFKGNFVGAPNGYARYFGTWRQEEVRIIFYEILLSD